MYCISQLFVEQTHKHKLYHQKQSSVNQFRLSRLDGCVVLGGKATAF